MTTKPPTSANKWKKIGKIGKAHGLKGAFYLGGRTSLWTEQALLLSVGADPECGFQSKLSSRQIVKGRVILSLECIGDRTNLEQHLGADLWCLEQDAHQAFDYDGLVDFKVMASCGQTLGQVNEFYNHGASDTFEIVSHDGAVLELPFVDAYIDKIDHKAASIKLCMNADAFTDLWQNS